MLVELAIGDAYGAGFEFAPDSFVRKQNTVSGYVQHPRHRHPPGNYTDDTQMSIALTEAILSDEPWTPKTIAAHFVRAFKRDPREGYARGFHGFLQEISDGEEFLARIRPHSDKSGGAMRAGPVGIFPSVDEVVEKCTVQAAITHDTRDGTNAAVAASLMTHYFLYDVGPRDEMREFVDAQVDGDWTATWRGKVRVKGIDCVLAALTALQSSNSLREVLRRCIAFTGDTDTAATIAMAAGSCSNEFDQDLPESLYHNLENGPYGRDYLKELDRRLLERVR